LAAKLSDHRDLHEAQALAKKRAKAAAPEVTILTLEQAYAILEKSSAVVMDDHAVTHASTAGLTGEADNDFVTLSWENDEGLFEFFFAEGANQQVKLVGSSMFLTDTDGDEVQISLLGPWTPEVGGATEGT
jgi:hypothetical protein